MASKSTLKYASNGLSRREVVVGAAASATLASLASALPALAEAAAESQTVVWPDPAVVGNWPEGASVGDDFYVWANDEWHKQAAIPEGHSRWSAFDDVAAEVKSDLMGVLTAEPETHRDQILTTIFKAAMDQEKRDAVGLSPLEGIIEALMSAQSVQDIADIYVNYPIVWDLSPLCVVNPLDDKKESGMRTATITPIKLWLQNPSEYSEMTQLGQYLASFTQWYAGNMFEYLGFDEATWMQMVNEGLGFEAKVAGPIASSAEQLAPDWPERSYNPYTRAELAELCSNLPILDILDAIGYSGAQKFLVEQPAFMQVLDEQFIDENLEGIRAKVLASLLTEVPQYGDSTTVALYNEMLMHTQGTTGTPSPEDAAYDLTFGLTEELIGVVYGERFFDKESMVEVESIMDKYISTFRSRLETNDWLGEETRSYAIQKLDAMKRRVGYPDKSLLFDWDALELNEDDSFLEIWLQMTRWQKQVMYACADKPIDYDQFPMSAATATACYGPTDNSINFLAAVLRPPFYDKDATPSAKFGSIGAVIGHEITHAFDVYGSEYDANGMIANWWTDEDRAAFSERTSRVAARYGSIDVLDGNHVNGDMTLGETVADLGAVSCGLQILGEMDDPNYEEFFLAFAHLWYEILTPEERLGRLGGDPHAPQYLRANVTCQQFQEFYDTFGITEGDFMYVPEDERLAVW